MTNNLLPMINSNNGRHRHWLQVIGCCLFTFSVAACGGGNNAPAVPEAASLEGDRREGPVETWKPAVDVSDAPTKEHGALARLVPNPGKALVPGSVRYGNWLAETAGYELDNPGEAALPMVMADYHSTGFELEKDPERGTRVEVSYPQRCKLFLIRAPESAAAPVIADKIFARLQERNFREISSLEDAGSTTDIRTIRRFSAIVENDKHDDVYIAYVLVAGDTVIYAVESETAEKIEIEGGQVSRVEEGGRGTRVGAMLISLIAWAMDNS
jgi:hypothetical protein